MMTLQSRDDTLRLPTPFGQAAPPIDKPTFQARAVYVGERIDVRSFTPADRLATHPLMVSLDGGGVAAVLRYGSVVFFDVAPEAEASFLRALSPRVGQPYANPETETMRLQVQPEARETVEGDTITLREASIQRLQVVAVALGKTVALAQYESDVAENFDRIHPFAVQLERGGRGGRDMRELLRHIGRGLSTEHKLVARVELEDRPELVWQHPELEPLYVRLEDEFELRERGAMLDHKLKLVAQTVGTVLGLLQYRRTLRVEWYIVVLIVFEVALYVYDLFIRG
jgi:uncharacterized Rmd1/YagE family protein